MSTVFRQTVVTAKRGRVLFCRLKKWRLAVVSAQALPVTDGVCTTILHFGRVPSAVAGIRRK